MSACSQKATFAVFQMGQGLGTTLVCQNLSWFRQPAVSNNLTTDNERAPPMSSPNLQLLSEFECFEIWNFVGK